MSRASRKNDLSVEQSNLAAMRALYAEAAAGNRAAVDAMLSDDLVITEADTLPYAGIYRGRGALGALSAIVHDYYGGMTLDIHAMTTGGDWVVTLLDILPANRPDRISLAEATRFRDGKIVEIKPYYFDTDQVRRLGVAGAPRD
jgi:ketosteroid isomerase-like protein